MGQASSKYRSVATVVDGIRFHSKGEARRWQELKLLERGGEITELRRQVPYMLHTFGPQHWKMKLAVGKYVADFVYIENGREIVEDFKGMLTPFARWKLRHFQSEYAIPVRLTGAASRKRAA